MKNYNCPSCKKEIIKDMKKYLKDYPEEKYIQCCYCGIHIPVLPENWVSGYLSCKKEVVKE